MSFASFFVLLCQNLAVTPMARVSDKVEDTKKVQPEEQRQPGVLRFDLADTTIKASYTVSVVNMATSPAEHLSDCIRWELGAAGSKVHQWSMIKHI